MPDQFLDMFVDSYEGYTSDADRYRTRYTLKYGAPSTPPFVPINKVKSVFALQIAGQDFVADLISFNLKSKNMDDDRVTMGRYKQGTARDWDLSIKAVFDGGSAGSLHDFLWQNPGGVTNFIIRPFQDFDPNDKKFYGGIIRIPNRPNLSVSAGQTSTFDYNFKVLGQPTRFDKALGILTGSYIDEY